MMAGRERSISQSSLELPRKSVELEDPGAHELSQSENEDEHFSDASEGRQTPLSGSKPSSPIPTTRVEKVDDTPSHGEVPGTSTYTLRTQDAVPDEMEIIPEGSRSRNSSTGAVSVPATERPIPTTKLTRVDSIPAHGEIPGTKAYDIRTEDASPDVVEKVDDFEGSQAEHSGQDEHARISNTEASNLHNGNVDSPEINDQDQPAGEDFDEFEEGEGDDDFGDFDDGFQQVDDDSIQQSERPVSVIPTGTIAHSFPPLHLEGVDGLESLIEATDPYLKALFLENTVRHDPPILEPLPKDNTVFLTDRSLSLWSQLVAPPPLQPPNWVRSRIRRLFLVSLGVPVDLDEILPASKQKKLILPSINLSESRSPRPSTEDRLNGSIARLKQENGSSGSVNSTSSVPSGRRRRGPPPPPELDLGGAKMISGTTDVALSNLTDEELTGHVDRLKELQQRASEVLEYWLKRKDGAVGDKEAFEGVIENLVKHARKVRK